MTVRCAHGHASQSEDYCDTCGDPLGAASSATPVDPNPDLTAVTCPTCTFPAAVGALFCENCGHDFTTDTSPEPNTGPRAVVAHAPVPQPEVPNDPVDLTPPDAKSSLDTPRHPQSTDHSTGWVVELWIDPDWYALQESSEPMPAPGPPQSTLVTGRSALVGRPSMSRDARPDIDCEPDSAVSRRHCLLTTDGLRWWVEDLQSANGTFAAAADSPLPTSPITPGLRREVEESDRLYLGAYTRLVIRQALPDGG